MCVATVYFFPKWAWWLIDSAFVLLTIVVIIVWGRRIMKHRVAYYSVMVIIVGTLFVHRLLKATDGLSTTLAGVWLFFVVLALVFSILDAREQRLR